MPKMIKTKIWETLNLFLILSNKVLAALMQYVLIANLIHPTHHILFLIFYVDWS